MTTTVRRASPDDVDWILSQLKEFSAFYGTKKQLFGDVQYSKKLLTELINKQHWWVSETNGSLVGFIGGVLYDHMYNPDIKVFSESFWWVAEDHRRSRAGLLLLNEFEKWGKENADWITFGLEEVSPVNERTLLKRGFRLHERSYLMEVEK